MRKMTRALIVGQRDMRYVRLILNSGKPRLNQRAHFTLKDVRHRLYIAGPRRGTLELKRLDHKYKIGKH
jgi:hypothetical protein